MWLRKRQVENSKVIFHYDESDYEESFYSAVKPGYSIDFISYFIAEIKMSVLFQL